MGPKEEGLLWGQALQQGKGQRGTPLPSLLCLNANTYGHLKRKKKKKKDKTNPILQKVTEEQQQ